MPTSYFPYCQIISLKNCAYQPSSISERLSVIEPSYFEKLYRVCLYIYEKLLTPIKRSLIRFDSTIVALSIKLLNVGYRLKDGDAAHIRQLKFTIGLSGLPVSVYFFTLIQKFRLIRKVKPLHAKQKKSL